ncbi:MAG: DUF362 domain-containing protein [Desulfobulbaceae bacterium]|nr:MAG: DUF362 domain-containing protein [Desulfobulbaceae bacterium]
MGHSRRWFVRQVALFTAGLSVSVPRFTYDQAEAAVPPAKKPLVVSVQGKDYVQLVRKGVELAGGIDQFVSSGDTVVVKPNIGWDRRVEQAANTHPLVVKTLVELALDGGAKRVQVFDYTCNDARRCYHNSGIKDALAGLGRKVQLEYIDERKFIPVEISKGTSLKRWKIYQDVLEADRYINVPVAKHHGLSRLTLGMKNVMGVIGGNRGRLHHDLGQKLADLATVVKPDLTVIDATRMLMNNGPQGGRLADVKQTDQLVLSADQVAADAYGTTLFGLPSDSLDSTVAAHKMGLGEMNLSAMQIIERTI